MNTGVGILHVIDRVFLAMREGQVNIKSKLGICPTLHQKETNRIQTYPVDELAHGGVAASALRDGELGAMAHHLDHIVQDIGGEITEDVQIHTLLTYHNPRHSLTVIQA